jgi:hypothetical protein
LGNLNIQYPLYFVLLVILLGFLFSLALYYRENKFKEKPKALIFAFFALRWISVSLIAFFLLEPFFNSIKDEVRKPVLIVAQDASQSMAYTIDLDSLGILNEKTEDLIENLGDKYDVKSLHFGSDIHSGLADSLSDPASNFDQLFQFAHQQYQGIPVASMILLSDGIYNLGRNPLYFDNINYPIQTIALGDTMQKADVAIKNVFFNPVAFVGDSIAIQFDLSAYAYSASQTRIQFEEIRDNKDRLTLQNKKIAFSSNDYFSKQSFETTVNESGTRHFRITVLPLENEKITSNNIRDIFIDVIDSRINVLVLADHPHPDLSALRQTLEKNKNYEVEVALLKDWKPQKRPDVVILHNLPSRNNPIESLLTQWDERKTPQWFILGSQSDLNRINKAQPLVSISNTNGSTNNATASFNQQFRSFEIEEMIRKEITQMPPLLVPYGEFKVDPDAQTLLFQKIGAVNTSYPLLSFSERNGLKKGLFLGEGLWRWRLNEFGRNGNQNAFEELLFKSLQYLSLKEDQRKWQVILDKKIWNENERVVFKGILYNDNYENVNSSEASLKIRNDVGEEFDFLFSRKSDYYTLDAGFLPEGSYQYTASNKTAGETFSTKGQFVVKSLQVELSNLQARHDLLYQLSRKTGGKVYGPGEIEQLQNDLLSKEVKSVVFSTESYLNLLNLKWLFFLILITLSLEWFLRRYHGAY